MPLPPQTDRLAELRAAAGTLAERIRELDRLCRDVLTRIEQLSERRPQVPELDHHQAALLVAVTLRGGTVDATSLESLTQDLGVGPPALEELFDGLEPHLVRRAGGAAAITERGIESAAEWRPALPAELLRIATDL